MRPNRPRGPNLEEILADKSSLSNGMPATSPLELSVLPNLKRKRPVIEEQLKGTPGRADQKEPGSGSSNASRGRDARALIQELELKGAQKRSAADSLVANLLRKSEKLTNSEWRNFTELAREFTPKGVKQIRGFLNSYLKLIHDGASKLDVEIFKGCFDREPIPVTQSVLEGNQWAFVRSSIPSLRSGNSFEEMRELAHKLIKLRDCTTEFSEDERAIFLTWAREESSEKPKSVGPGKRPPHPTSIFSLAELVVSRMLETKSLLLEEQRSNSAEDGDGGPRPVLGNKNRAIRSVISLSNTLSALEENSLSLSSKAHFSLLKVLHDERYEGRVFKLYINTLEEGLAQRTDVSKKVLELSEIFARGFAKIRRAESLLQANLPLHLGILPEDALFGSSLDKAAKRTICENPELWAETGSKLREQGIELKEGDWPIKRLIAFHLEDLKSDGGSLEANASEKIARYVNLVEYARSEPLGETIELKKLVECLEETELKEHSASLFDSSTGKTAEMTAATVALSDLPEVLTMLDETEVSRLLLMDSSDRWLRMVRERRLANTEYPVRIFISNGDILLAKSASFDMPDYFFEELTSSRRASLIGARVSEEAIGKYLDCLPSLSSLLQLLEAERNTIESDFSRNDEFQTLETAKQLCRLYFESPTYAASRCSAFMTLADEVKSRTSFTETEVVRYICAHLDKPAEKEASDMVLEFEAMEESGVPFDLIPNPMNSLTAVEIACTFARKQLGIEPHSLFGLELPDKVSVFGREAIKRFSQGLAKIVDSQLWAESPEEKSQFVTDAVWMITHYYKDDEVGRRQQNHYVSRCLRSLSDLLNTNLDDPSVLSRVYEELEQSESSRVPVPQILRDVAHALKREKRVHRLDHNMRLLVRGASGEHARNASAWIHQDYRNGAVPYAIETHEAKVMTKEVFQVIRRGFDHSDGFASLTYDARRAPGTRWPVLARYAKDLAFQVRELNFSSNDEFPGRGYLVSGLQPENFLVSDVERPSEPFADYKIAWPWAAKAIDDIGRSSFLFARGCIAVIGPRDESGYDFEGVHYSYLVYNEHFHNPNRDAAFLVPTILLEEALKGRTRELGHSFPTEDVSRFDPHSLDVDWLKQRGKELGHEVLNLCWPSNVAGLANAYPPKSSPYFEWERTIESWHTKDAAGHVHSSHITDRYLDTMNSEMERLLEPLRLGHKRVFETATAYQNLLDIQRLSLGFWHKGQTVALNDEDILEAEDDFEQETLLDGEVAFHPLMGRMLNEAIDWFEAVITKKLPKEEAPILCVAPVLEYSAMPARSVQLDSATLTIKSPNGEFVLKPVYDSHSNLIQFVKAFGSGLSTFSDLRFYHPKELG